MRKVCVASIQMKCSREVNENILTADRLVRTAAEKGAEIILLPELFERQYFCQERRYEYYGFAKPVEDNDAVKHFLPVSEELNIVLPLSIYEKDGNVLYNTVVVLDCGKILEIYRKTHIPDDHFYQEKFYFTPGNTGFVTFKTTYGQIGIGICWDQWFPETARCLTLNGAELLFYPTAIGSEPILNCDSMKHWRNVMKGHAAANIIPVIAANRYGLEEVTPCDANGNQSSSLEFYGSGFITDATGELLCESGRKGDDILLQEFDLDEIAAMRLEWGLFRDRRPECYEKILK